MKFFNLYVIVSSPLGNNYLNINHTDPNQKKKKYKIKKIITEIVRPERRPEAYNFIKQQIKEGRQVFVICPRIEIPDSQQEIKDLRGASWSDVKAVKQEYERLKKDVFPKFKVTMLHGRMKNEEKHLEKADIN